jgi:predicted  nucleic acid-binding Zn-ribbon protein
MACLNFNSGLIVLTSAHLYFVHDDSADPILKISVKGTNIISSSVTTEQDGLIVHCKNHKIIKDAVLMANKNGENVELFLNGQQLVQEKKKKKKKKPKTPQSPNNLGNEVQIKEDVTPVSLEEEFTFLISDNKALSTLADYLPMLSDSTSVEDMINIREDVDRCIENGPKFLVTNVEPFCTTRCVIALTEEDIVLQPLSSAANLIKFNLTTVSHVYKKPWRNVNVALEIFFGETSIFVAFDSTSDRDSFYDLVLTKSTAFETLALVTQKWVEGQLSNYDYLIRLNHEAGRTFKDVRQYPIVPWILRLDKIRGLKTIDLDNVEIYRDLSLPINKILDLESNASHVSDPRTVIRLLSVKYPNLLLLLPEEQIPKFANIEEEWKKILNSGNSIECIPELYENESVLVSSNKSFNVSLPDWAGDSASVFVKLLREALNSSFASDTLPPWIDLIFGVSQQETSKALNGKNDLQVTSSIDVATSPAQLFNKPHPVKTLTGEMGQRHAEITESMEEFDKEISDQLAKLESLEKKRGESTSPVELEDVVKKQQQKILALQNEIEQKGKDIVGLRKDVSERDTNLERLEREVGEQQHQIKTLNQNLSDERDSGKKKVEELEKTKQESEKLKQNLEVVTKEAELLLKTKNELDTKLTSELQSASEQGNRSDQLSQQIEIAAQKIKELETTVSSQGEKATEYESKISALQNKVTQSGGAISDNHSAIVELQNTIDSLKQDISTKTTELDSYKVEKIKEIDGLKDGIVLLQKEESNLREALETEKHTVSTRDEDINQLKKRVEDREQLIEQLKDSIVALEKEGSLLKQSLQNENKSVEEKSKELDTIQATLQQQLDEKTDQINKLNEELQEKNDHIQTTHVKVTELSKEGTELKEQLQAEKQTVTEKESEIESIQLEQQQKVRKIEQLNNEKQALEEEGTDLRDTIASEQDKVKNLETLIIGKVNELDEKRTMISKLTTEKETLQNEFTTEKETLQSEIERLKSVAAERDQQIETLTQTVINHEADIETRKVETDNLKASLEQRVRTMM